MLKSAIFFGRVFASRGLPGFGGGRGGFCRRSKTHPQKKLDEVVGSKAPL